ncbi:MAG: hypothetical protein AB1347_10160 [Acidobacteriota bacterium]
MGKLKKTSAILLAAGLLALLLHAHPAPEGEGIGPCERHCPVCASAGGGADRPGEPLSVRTPDAPAVPPPAPVVCRPVSAGREAPRGRAPPA